VKMGYWCCNWGFKLMSLALGGLFIQAAMDSIKIISSGNI